MFLSFVLSEHCWQFVSDFHDIYIDIRIILYQPNIFCPHRPVVHVGDEFSKIMAGDLPEFPRTLEGLQR